MTIDSGRPGTRPAATSALGAGIVDVPPVTVPDPAAMVLTDPHVPESWRFCGVCRRPVGRSRDGRPGRTEGFCVRDGTPFSFSPALRRGDVVGPFEVSGCLAHGGQGWVYLGRNRRVADTFWVVLKGLLNPRDPGAVAAAESERLFLASVDHPNIVKINAFVDHGDADYIVMEYVAGMSLQDLLERRRAAAGRADPLPVTHAVAYVLAILRALGYLHRRGLIFCDLKPGNVMVGDDVVKLIDLGAVRRLDETKGRPFGTPGYEAPEVPSGGVSVASDLFTVGRTLASLILDFAGKQTVHRYELPPRDDHPSLVRHESLYRALLRATAQDPADRFASAEEMADELLGVLYEIVAEDRVTDAGGDSEIASVPPAGRRFTSDVHLTGEDSHGRRAVPAWTVLPRLRTDPADPAAATLAALPDADPEQVADLLAAIEPATVGVRLRQARAYLEADRPGDARALVDAVATDHPHEWRVHWFRGLLLLTGADAPGAVAAFDRVFTAVPGEAAPKLALALAAEVAGELPRAAGLYDRVSRTDPRFTSAAFGLARVRSAAGDRSGAVEAYSRVPPTSAAYVEARCRAILTLVTRHAGDLPDADDLAAASRILDRLPLDPDRRATLTRDVLRSALDLVTCGAVEPSGTTAVAGSPLREHDLRLGLERAYRTLARRAASSATRIALVEEANRVRPRTVL